jgi:putative CocE/NonD family hydrolase
MRSVVSFLDKLSEGGFFEVPLRHIQSLESLGLANIIGRLLDLPPGKQRTGYRINFTDVEVPSLNIAGWYDIFQQYTIDNFMSVITRGKRLARCAHLLIGPWMHGVIAANPGMMIGEINFGSGASGASIDLKQDLTSIQLRWFDHWLKHIDNGVERETPVKFLLTGENRWIESPCWPPQETQETPLFLHAGGRLNFKLPEDANNATFFTYDPANPAPTLGGNAPVERPGVRDQRPLSERSDVLTFTCSTLEQKLTVVGRIIADLWVSSSAPDTDFVARLIDVHPSGYMQNLCDGIIRARYRESLQEPSWLEPGKVFNLKVDLWSIAHVFKPGHRLAVQITGSSFPRWDRNWNTAGNPGAAISGQPARQTIWHSTEHPSHIILPVLKN